jgi:hypothetical protein
MARTKPDSTAWFARLEEAKSLQSVQHPQWRESLALYMGDWFKMQGASDPDATAVNYSTSYIKTLVDSTYARNPYIFVKPRHSRYVNFAYSLARMVNYYWRELNIKRQMKRAVFHTSLYGLSWLETGYTTQIGQFDLSLSAEGQQEELLFNKLLGDNKQAQQQGVLNEYIKAISPYAIARSPYRVLMAPGYQYATDMPYLFIAEDISPEDISNHPTYSKAIDTERVKPTRIINTYASLISGPVNPRRYSGSKDADIVMYRLWHVWDRRNMEHRVLVEDSDITIGPYPWSYSHEGFPLVPLMWNEPPESDKQAQPYPQGDLVPMLPLLRELNQLRTAMVRHRKRSGTVIIVPDTMSEEEIKALKTGDDVAIVKVSGAFIEQIKPFSPPQLAPDVYRINERILADLDIVGGFSQTILGGQAAKDTLATEINTQNQSSAIRTSSKIDEVEAVSVDIARRLAANIWEFMPREKVRQLLGETELTDSMWPQLPDDPDERREFIQSEILVEMEAGATQPVKDRTIERKQWLDTINVLMAIAPNRIKESELIKRTLEKFDEPNIDSILISDDEIHMPSIQAENQLLAQGIPQVVTPDEPHELHLAEHGKLAQQGMANPALDDHIAQHAAFYRQKGPQTGRGPQQGDSAPQGGAVAPDAKRAGVPGEQDLTGPVGRVLTEAGMEKGGIRNV